MGGSGREQARATETVNKCGEGWAFDPTKLGNCLVSFGQFWNREVGFGIETRVLESEPEFWNRELDS